MKPGCLQRCALTLTNMSQKPNNLLKEKLLKSCIHHGSENAVANTVRADAGAHQGCAPVTAMLSALFDAISQAAGRAMYWLWHPMLLACGSQSSSVR